MLKFYSTGTGVGGGEEYVLPCKVSCGRCGSHVADEGRRVVLVFPGLVEWGKGWGGREERGGRQ